MDRNSQPISKSLITIAVSGSCRFTTASVFPVLDLPKSANSLPILIFPVRLCQSASITPDHCNLEPLSVPFPFERLTEPLIYASLGTVQNTKEIFLHAERMFGFSHGGGMRKRFNDCPVPHWL